MKLIISEQEAIKYFSQGLIDIHIENGEPITHILGLDVYVSRDIDIDTNYIIDEETIVKTDEKTYYVLEWNGLDNNIDLYEHKTEAEEDNVYEELDLSNYSGVLIMNKERFENFLKAVEVFRAKLEADEENEPLKTNPWVDGKIRSVQNG